MYLIASKFCRLYFFLLRRRYFPALNFKESTNQWNNEKTNTSACRKSLKISIANSACYELIFELPSFACALIEVRNFMTERIPASFAAHGKKLSSPSLGFVLANGDITKCKSVPVSGKRCKHVHRQRNQRCDSLFALNGFWILELSER